MSSITPYRVQVGDDVLDDLSSRLARTRWPDHLEGSGWDMGTEMSWLQEVCEYWRQDYDWRIHEAAINAWPQGMTTVAGEQVHFIHVRSPHSEAAPMLLLNGWGSSIIEFLDVLDRLSDPPAYGGDAADACHLVVPSLPGFGFSGPTRQRGFHVHRMADAMAELMEALGYADYIAHGGDWGAMIVRRMGEAYADRLRAVHFTQLFAFPTDQDDDPMAGVTAEDQALMAPGAERAATGTGYFAIQSTRPQSLAYGQVDSPVGLAGWLLEKFHAWVDHDGDLEAVVPRDKLLTNVMLYWATNTVFSSARLYYESAVAGVHATDPWNGRVDVPTGYTVYPQELMYTPRAWADRRYNIVYWATQPRGGHFAALERPEPFATDLWHFHRTLRDAEI